MTSPNFAVVNMRDGIRRDVQSFLVSNDSFPTLENAYLFRGRIQKRSCFKFVGNSGRLNGTIGTTDGAGNFSITLLDGMLAPGIPNATAIFSVTLTVMGTPTTVILTDPTGGAPVTLLSTNVLVSGTLDTTTGALSISGADALSPVIYYPGLPVMGLRTLESTPINDEALIAFDTRYTYLFDRGVNDFIFQNTFADTNNPFIWTGADSDLFWSTNYFQAFWATNNVPGYHVAQNISPIAERDGIRWYGTLPGVPPPGTSATGWRNFNPILHLDAGPTNVYLLGALIIVPYKDRLVCLNTVEGINLASGVRFAQRARWCQNGTPFYGDSPLNTSAQADSWRDDINGKGDFLDAPTSEAIVSAEFIKDTLIVYFERSTWQLIYSYNETLPFVWQKINTELGADSTFSTVPFDRGVFTVGNYGIITCDSVNVQRIDQKIPDEVFEIQNKNLGVKRVFGIRDYSAQLVYWTAPFLIQEDNEAPSYDLTFPNQVIVYNYLDGSWAEFDDSFTCFGYWQKLEDDTWASSQINWEVATYAWNSGVIQSRFPDVIAGNQRGFVLIFSQLANLTQNSPSLAINNINPATRLITCPNHNLINGQYVLINGVQGTTGINTLINGSPAIYKVESTTVDTITLDKPTTTPPTYATWTGTYTGGGFITHIPNMFIQTKEFNPFYEQGDSIRVNYIDAYLNRTTNGQFDAQFYTSDNTSLPIEDVLVNTSPEPMPTYSSPSPTTNFQLQQNKIWHRIYTNSFGSFVQNIFTLSDTQIRNLSISTSEFTLHGLIYYVNQSGRISYDI